MYLEKTAILNLRVFATADADFQHPRRLRGTSDRKPEYPNLNLILGNNGAGKSTLLKAIALACLGPLAEKFPPYMLVRRSREAKKRRGPSTVAESVFPDDRAMVRARFQCTWQDVGEKKPSDISKDLEWSFNINRTGDEESIEMLYAPKGDVTEEARALWAPIHQHSSPAFLTVGYGATRRVDTDPNAPTPVQRLRTLPLRHQRIQSLFTEGYTLVSLGHWLPQLKARNPGRFKQVFHRINEVLPDDIEFTARTDNTGEYLFCQQGASVPFAALSDGCRAYIGWVADLLYHICFGCPSGVKLEDNCGIVLVDEIDLHLHPEWQRAVLPRLAKAFPRLQFIVTTHSPIVVGTLQRENLWVCEPAPDGHGSILAQKQAGVHGLNSDQILLTEYFRLKTSRAPKKERRLDRIAAAAERKVPGRASAFLRSLVTPLEDEDPHD
jgi:energy-coupling factor transporter ATP-binding protein EcfA2